MNHISDSENTQLPDTGLPVLQQAIQIKSFAEVERLIQEGHDVNEINYYGLSPLDMAAGSGDLKIARFLLDSGASVSYSHDACPLYEAIMNGHADVAKLLIEAGAYVNFTIDDGYTLLMQAVIVNNLEIVRLLVEAGADINVKACDGASATTIATEEGYQAILKYLTSQSMIKG